MAPLVDAMTATVEEVPWGVLKGICDRVTREVAGVASRRSRVMAPRHRTPRPGPGKGWRYTISSGSPPFF